VAFTLSDSTGAPRLAVRGLDREDVRVLDGTEDASWPFWSPDSRDIAFFAAGRLRRIPAAGGAVRSLCDASIGRGGSWGAGGTIVFSPDARGGLWAVDAGGGTPRKVTEVDSTRGETSHRFPSFLPDGRHFLFTVNDVSGKPESPVRVAALDDPRPKPLLEAATAAVFAAPDRVVFTRELALLSQRLDLRSFRLVGEPQLLADEPEVNGPIQLTPIVSCSRNGAMIYTPRDARPTAIARMSRDGRLEPTGVRFPLAVGNGALAPDGRRYVVMDAANGGFSNWMADLESGAVTQIALPGRGVFAQLWNPAGTRFLGPSMSGLRQVDPSGNADSLFDFGDQIWRVPNGWTPDGRTLVLSALVEGNRYDLQTLAMAPGEKPRPFAATAANESDGRLSPDGRLIAYWSDASGSREVSIERFPDRSEAVRVGVPSTAAGFADMRWSADGSVLQFFGGDGLTLYAAEVRTAPRLSVGAARILYRLPAGVRDVTLLEEGRALVLLPEGERPQALTVVHGWMGEAAAAR